MNQIKQKNNKNSIISLILGIVSLLPIVTRFLVLPFLHFPLEFFLQIILFIIFFITPFFSIGGVIFGLLGLKFEKKVFAVIGIILCLIGLWFAHSFSYYFLF